MKFSEELLFKALDDLLENHDKYKLEIIKYATIIESYDTEKIIIEAVAEIWRKT